MCQIPKRPSRQYLHAWSLSCQKNELNLRYYVFDEIRYERYGCKKHPKQLAEKRIDKKSVFGVENEIRSVSTPNDQLDLAFLDNIVEGKWQFTVNAVI